MDVLQGDDQGTSTARLDAHLAEDLGGADLDAVDPRRVERLGALLDSEEAEQVGQRALHLDPEPLEALAELGGHRGRPVGLADEAGGAEDLQHRQERDRRAVGETVALDVGDRRPAEPLPELVEQPRLADARLPDDPHDLAAPGASRGQAAVEEVELLPAPHEAGHLALDAQPGPLAPAQVVKRAARSRAARVEARARRACRVATMPPRGRRESRAPPLDPLGPSRSGIARELADRDLAHVDGGGHRERLAVAPARAAFCTAMPGRRAAGVLHRLEAEDRADRWSGSARRCGLRRT